jgi:F-type H+-transporting ATPase subunit b
MLELDISLFGVFALVAILLFVLNRVYFKPVGQVMEERENKIETENAGIDTNMREIEEKTQHIETVLKDAQKDSRKIKEELIKKGEEVREQVIINARENSKEMLAARMKQLDEEIMMAEKKLEQEISVFSNKIKEIFMS